MKENTEFKKAMALYERTLLKRIYRKHRKKMKTKSQTIEVTAFEAGLGVKRVWKILKDEK